MVGSQGVAFSCELGTPVEKRCEDRDLMPTSGMRESGAAFVFFMLKSELDANVRDEMEWGGICFLDAYIGKFRLRPAEV